MDNYMREYHHLCLLHRRKLNADDVKNNFDENSLRQILNTYQSIERFISLSLQENEFEKRYLVMFTLCRGCQFYDICSGDKHAKCTKNKSPNFQTDIEFSGNTDVLKWFYVNALLFLNEYSEKNRILGNFYNVFLRISRIKLKGKYIIMYADSFRHYERVKNAVFLSYQGTIVEEYLLQIMKMVDGKEYEFYLDNSANETEIKSPIEEKLFKALDNHPYLRKKYKYNLEKHSLYTDDLGNVLFELDMLMTVNRDIQIAIECDGYNYHSDPHRFYLDRRRDRTLLKSGILTVRFSSDDINYHLEESVAELVSIIEYQVYGRLTR